jgi:hypothetical protein
MPLLDRCTGHVQVRGRRSRPPTSATPNCNRGQAPVGTRDLAHRYLAREDDDTRQRIEAKIEKLESGLRVSAE